MIHARMTLLALTIALAGCGSDADAESATAELQPLGGSTVTGKVTFTEKDGKVLVEADISGLMPGKHGFHIHEFGDCSAPDGSSAGGHFNPEGHMHGAPGASSHPGDLGNLDADGNGRAMLTITLEKATIASGPLSIVGRGLIVHEKADDLVSQPVGEAGGRQACAVIKSDDGETAPVLKTE
jgi:Cu-Zn family superoxide dismutase